MKKIIEFFKDVRTQFKQISWPKKDSLIQSTIVVISISIIVSLILGAFDYIFTQSINFLGKSPQTQTQNISPTVAPLLPTLNLPSPTK